MAFVFYVFMVAVQFDYIAVQIIYSTKATYEINLVNISSSQSNDDSTLKTASTIESYSDRSNEVYNTEYKSSSATEVTIKWNKTNFSNEKVQIVQETTSFPPSITTMLQQSSSTLDNSKAITFMTGKIENKTDSATTMDTSTFNTKILQLDTNNSELIQEGEYTMSENSNVTISLTKWNTINSSQESYDYTTVSNNERGYLLKSNCSILESDNIAASKDFADTDCTIYLSIKFSSDNETRDQLLNILKTLTIKPDEFQVVKMHNQDEDASRQVQRSCFFDTETLAYIAIALAFAFLLLLALIVFGVRCFKKRRPSLDISHFDVRLSNYTLTKIPRASLSSLDYLPESDGLDDKPESSTAQNKDESCESGLDITPCETDSSNREMKTFGVVRSNNNRNIDYTLDTIPKHNCSPTAYENHTFQRYF